ncbi:hypothetical protein O6H91_19G023800 [Diphasiastrum complanatum]|uniref:Uncharacterized protein n=1 Tax=Diphasiastrum complanatum TaxID=34168 RepID=A0ACC2ATE1_DIPCM|nr:hypothetical protein O6H91_19G023800 [Diphasiastrum complanatum]
MQEKIMAIVSKRKDRSAKAAVSSAGKVQLRSGTGDSDAEESDLSIQLPSDIEDYASDIENLESEEDEGQGDAAAAAGDDDDEYEEGPSAGEDEDIADGNLRDIDDAMLDFMQEHSARVDNGTGSSAHPSDDEASERDGDLHPSAVESDSSEDEIPSRNTVGDVPFVWYDNEEHIGYDIFGKKLRKKERRNQLDSFLARSDDLKDWRKVYDEYNDEEVQLTSEEIDMIRRIRQGRIPHAEVNPHESYVDWFTWEDKGHPLSSAPEPKRRFIPSKWEAKKVVKLVRALRKGWLKLETPKEKPRFYMLWGDDLRITENTANGLAYVPAPKTKLPGHEESYNPPFEYIPTQEEVNSYQLMYEEDRPKFLPRKFDSLRMVPAYADFIKERFERCLDLYLCPRSRKKRINIDPEILVPKLPKPKDLQPFPTVCFLEYRGHVGAICSISTEPSGQWLVSASYDGTVRLWEVQTGRCCRVWNMNGRVHHVSWNPNPQLSIIAVSVEREIVLLDTNVGDEAAQANVSSLLTVKDSLSVASAEKDSLVTWTKHDLYQAIKITHQQSVASVSWHHKGDYFASVSPEGHTRAVLVHQLSKQQTQNPFRKHHGHVVSVLFHPLRPFLFVATKMHVRVYNLAKQQLSKKLMPGFHELSTMAVHPSGDNLIVGSKENKLCWFDMDLSVKPYKTLKNHEQDISAVAFHNSYPLFASCSLDGTAHVFHGMVYSDLLQNPLIVPLKILHGHQKGVLDCKFHPQQPWLFTAGGDAIVRLYCN